MLVWLEWEPQGLSLGKRAVTLRVRAALREHFIRLAHRLLIRRGARSLRAEQLLEVPHGAREERQRIVGERGGLLLEDAVPDEIEHPARGERRRAHEPQR